MYLPGMQQIFSLCISHFHMSPYGLSLLRGFHYLVSYSVPACELMGDYIEEQDQEHHDLV